MNQGAYAHIAPRLKTCLQALGRPQPHPAPLRRAQGGGRHGDRLCQGARQGAGAAAGGRLDRAHRGLGLGWGAPRLRPAVPRSRRERGCRGTLSSRRAGTGLGWVTLPYAAAHAAEQAGVRTP